MTEVKKRIIDLSHIISPDMPHWPGDLITHIEESDHGLHAGYHMNNVHIGEHSGTHIGAPSHFGFGAHTVDSIPAEQLIVYSVKINLCSAASMDPDLLLQPGHIAEWEERNGEIRNCLVLVETGWSRYWADSKRYFGWDHGNMHFPGVSLSAAQILVKQKKIIGLGIDTAGIDGGMVDDLTVNRYLAEHQVYHLENLNNLKLLPETKFEVFIGALPIKNGHGSPCRVLAVVE
jgi:kynurenine formamidase